MKVLVTGATGFIGNYVIEELLKRNIDIVATSTNIDKARDFDWFPKVHYLPFNFSENSEDDLYAFFQYPDILIHLAWKGLPFYKSDFHTTENLPEQKKFLTNLIQNGLRHITITGTCFEYGMKEGELSEMMESKPENAYAIAKNNLRIYLERFDINLKWIRLFYMYGKGQNEKSLISQLDKALEKEDKIFNMSGGEQLRDFLPVEKVAQNIINIATQNKVKGIINCCSGHPVSVKDFVQNYLQFKNKNIKLNLGYYPYPDFEPFKFWGNNEKLNKILNEIH